MQWNKFSNLAQSCRREEGGGGRKEGKGGGGTGCLIRSPVLKQAVQEQGICSDLN